MGTSPNYCLGSMQISGNASANFELGTNGNPASYIVGISGCNWMGSSGSGIGVSLSAEIVPSSANPGTNCIQVTQNIINMTSPTTAITNVVVLGTWLESLLLVQQASQPVYASVPSAIEFDGFPATSTAVVSGFHIQNASSSSGSISGFGFSAGAGCTLQDGSVVPASMSWGMLEGNDDFTDMEASTVTAGLILSSQSPITNGMLLVPVSVPIGTLPIDFISSTGFPTGNCPVVALFQGFAVEQSESMTGSMPGLIVSLPAALTATTVNGNTVIIGAVECTVYLGSVMNLGSQGALNLLVVCLDPSQTYVFPSS